MRDTANSISTRPCILKSRLALRGWGVQSQEGRQLAHLPWTSCNHQSQSIFAPIAHSQSLRSGPCILQDTCLLHFGEKIFSGYLAIQLERFLVLLVHLLQIHVSRSMRLDRQQATYRDIDLILYHREHNHCQLFELEGSYIVRKYGQMLSNGPTAIKATTAVARLLHCQRSGQTKGTKDSGNPSPLSFHIDAFWARDSFI